MICLGQFYWLGGSDGQGGHGIISFRPKYGELRTSDTLIQQAISGATHQGDLVWLKNESGYRAAIQYALDQSLVPLTDLRPAECELDEKSNVVSSGGRPEAFLVHQYLQIFYPFDTGLFDEAVTAHDLDRFNQQLAKNLLYFRSQLSEDLGRFGFKKDLMQVALGCNHTLCRGCAWQIQRLEKDQVKCPTCRAPIENASLVKRLPAGDACPVCLEPYQMIERFGPALGAELRFSPIQTSDDK